MIYKCVHYFTEHPIKNVGNLHIVKFRVFERFLGNTCFKVLLVGYEIGIEIKAKYSKTSFNQCRTKQCSNMPM